MSSTRPTPPPQRADTRTAILDAAIAMYASAGPRAASLRNVARSAGVTQPLVSQYFGSKAGLTAAVGSRLTAHVAAEIGRSGSCDAESFPRLIRAARKDRSMTTLLIRSALGDLSPSGFAECLGGSSPTRGGATDGPDGRWVQICRYAASSLLLGWLTFDRFFISAVDLSDMSERRRDEAIGAAASHVWALATTDRPTQANNDDTTEPMIEGARQPAARSTRDTLLAAAVELLAQHGPASMSIRDVARHAGLNHGLLHRHFGSKHALVAEAIEAGVGSLMPGALAEGGFDIDQVVRVMHDDPVPARLIARAVVDDIAIDSVRLHYPVMDGVLALARSTAAEARPPGLDDPRIAASAAASMVGGSVIWGPSLGAAGGFGGEMNAALADLSRELLGLDR